MHGSGNYAGPLLTQPSDRLAADWESAASTSRSSTWKRQILAWVPALGQARPLTLHPYAGNNNLGLSDAAVANALFEQRFTTYQVSQRTRVTSTASLVIILGAKGLFDLSDLNRSCGNDGAET
ncbi:hypothetical protein MTO96_039250 [Rhipicephalus appendiculatus]